MAQRYNINMSTSLGEVANYIKYSTGMIRQWGTVSNYVGGTVEINFLIPFTDTNYNYILSQQSYNDGSLMAYKSVSANKFTNKFQFVQATAKATWIVEGF